MTVQRTLNPRDAVPVSNDEGNATKEGHRNDSASTSWDFGGTTGCLSALQEQMGVAGAQGWGDMDSSAGRRLGPNMICGSALVIMNSIYLANVNQRQQGIDDCVHNATCVAAHPSYAAELVLSSGVAPQESSAALTGIFTGLGLLGYSMVQIGMMILNRYRDA